MAFNFTEGQSRAISSRGNSVLVSAAAGSGKTRVLTERLMSYITDKSNPRDISSFLVITYTRAAAAELKSRIIDELGKRAAQNPLDSGLRRQQNLCYSAQIGTIHSFCTEVIRENCHHIGLSPAFSVMDDDRGQTMKAAILEKILEERYEKIDDDADFAYLVDTVGAGRDDTRLVKIILSLHSKMLSHAYPDEWAKAQIELLSLPENTDIAETVWGREIIENARISAKYHADALDSAADEIAARDDKLTKAYLENFTDDALHARDFLRALDEGWDRARSFVVTDFSRLGSLRGYDDTQFQERMKAVRNGYKDAMKSFSAIFAQSSAEHLSDIRKTAPAARSLLGLVLDFDKAFAAEKKRRGLLDFSDLEHYACSLLVDKATGKPTWIAVELASRYTEIMVDEYQDVNAVQDMIFRAVSRNEKNLFMVGDVKQSIYRFRLADPTIFLEKYERYTNTDDGEKILLQDNFRSRKCVLDASNSVFRAIMSKQLGELDYDDEAALHFSSLAYPDGTDETAELCIIVSASDDDEETPEKAQIEASYIARRINEMVSSRVQVYEDGVGRDCRYGDFALLMRSPAGKGAVFHRVLSENGIPVQSRLVGGFFESIEISTVINLLTVIDNPHADIALIAVLRSALFSFTPDDLSEIRTANKDADFYTALLCAAESGNEKCAGFAQFLGRLRKISADTSLSELIWKIYSDTDLFALCSALADGDTRRNNLMCLFEYAKSFEQNGYRGVFRFVHYLRRAAERGEEPNTSAPADDAVKILSIHKSKGLEFPFVFLCDTAHRFNQLDLHENVLIHAGLGLGLKVTDTQRGLEYPCITRQAIELRMKTELLSEEMRVLYVGMTRAKEKLIMTAVWDNAHDKYDKLTLGVQSPIAPAVLARMGSMSHWLALAAHCDGGRTIDVKIVSPTTQQTAAENSADDKTKEIDFSEQYEALRHNLSFEYPFAASESIPSKLSATELKGLHDSDDIHEEAHELYRRSTLREFRLPDFSEAQRLTAAQRGTATHKLLQFIRLDKTQSVNDISEEISRLVCEARLTEQEGKAINAQAVREFFASDLGREILSADEVKREFRFTLLMDAKKHFSDAAGGDSILLQGIIDLFFIKNGEVTVVDYKTDRISKDEVSERAQSYREQLSTYADAISRITGLKVRRSVLYFLVPAELFEI